MPLLASVGTRPAARSDLPTMTLYRQFSSSATLVP